MDSDVWRTVLVGGLALNAALGFGYRVYRLSNGGPIADVWGQALLGALLLALAASIGLGAEWPRWLAVAYAALFAILAMPVWVLAVLIPLRPGRVDYAFTALYWSALIVIGVAGLAL